MFVKLTKLFFEKTKMRYINNFALFLVALMILAGCSSKIDGEVFVVTKGGEVKKLALVDIKAYKITSKDDFKKSLINDFRTYAKVDSNPTDINFDVRNLTKALNNQTKDMEQIKAQSDADGRFQLSIPNGDYIVSAVGGREAPNENYLWLMKIPKDGKLRLANDTMYDKGCEYCLMASDNILEISIIQIAALDSHEKKLYYEHEKRVSQTMQEYRKKHGLRDPMSR